MLFIIDRFPVAARLAYLSPKDVALPRPVCYRARLVASPTLLLAAAGGEVERGRGRWARQHDTSWFTPFARYKPAPRGDKPRILDESVAVTGYHRKHAIRLPTAEGGTCRRGATLSGVATTRRGRLALVTLRKASDRLCGKRLKAALPLLVDTLERHGHLDLDERARE